MFAKPLPLGICAIAAAGAWTMPQAAVAQCHDYVVRRAYTAPVVVHHAPAYVATYPVYAEPVYVERPVVAHRPYYAPRARYRHHGHGKYEYKEKWDDGKYEYKEKWDGGRYKYKAKWDDGRYRYKESWRGRKHRGWSANVHVGRGHHGRHLDIRVRRYR